MDQLICHLLGDYAFQNQYLSDYKKSSWWVAAVHGAIYASTFLLPCFVAPTPGAAAIAAIFGTHVVIDRLSLAGYWIRFYGIGCEGTVSGPPLKEVPAWLSTILAIVVDNTIHLVINYLAIKYL